MPETRQILREMAWQRAKGELNSMLATYPSPFKHEAEKCERMKEEMEKFFKVVEDNDLDL